MFCICHHILEALNQQLVSLRGLQWGDLSSLCVLFAQARRASVFQHEDPFICLGLCKRGNDFGPQNILPHPPTQHEVPPLQRNWTITSDRLKIFPVLQPASVGLSVSVRRHLHWSGDGDSISLSTVSLDLWTQCPHHHHLVCLIHSRHHHLAD